jgi:UPF0716 protein FxsA
MSPPEKQTARSMPIALLVLIAFITVPLLEIAIFIKVGGVIGLGWTLALIIATAMLGTWMLRRQGFQVLRRAQRQLDQGVAPVAEVVEGVCLLIAGLLLLTPGFFTDALGGLLLLPPVRALIMRELRARVEAHVSSRGGRAPGAAGQRGPTVIEADYEEVESRDPGADAPPADDPPAKRMPPPRGGWGPRG